jgi:CO/xanthine dehydrogenase FAD-binding subunit
MRSFQFLEPRSVDEVSAILWEYGDEARIIAGGTNLIRQMRENKAFPRIVVGLKKLALAGIEFEGGKVVIGSLATLQQIASSAEVQKYVPLLAEAAGQVGAVQTRNLGTIGGNICNASPAADTAAALLALEAMVCVAGPQGAGRRLPVNQFFTGPGQTVLGRGEWVVGLEMAPMGALEGGAYLKIGRRKGMDIATVGAAAFVSLDPSGVCRRARIALEAVAPTPLRAGRAEAMLQGGPLDRVAIARASREAMGESQPITDHRASAEYRRAMVEVLVRRALNLAGERAVGRSPQAANRGREGER